MIKLNKRFGDYRRDYNPAIDLRTKIIQITR